MDQKAADLLGALKRPAARSDTKLELLNNLKSDIKHLRVPEGLQNTIFECLRLAIAQQASASLASSAFSTLGHLIKRLKIQDASGHAITQLAPKLFPAIHDRLGDLREPVRACASQALTELYPYLGEDVEHMIREEAIAGSNKHAKEAGMQWVLRMHKEESMPFKSYVSDMVARLEDADGNVRETGKSVLIELFKDAPDRAKTDLKKQLKAHSVRHAIESQVLIQIGGTVASRPQTANVQAETEVDLAASTRSLPTLDHGAHFAESINGEAAQPPPPETVQMDPIYMHSAREVEDMFRDMLPHFEGKESEQNWMPRDKNIMKLRRVLKGNAPNEFHIAFMAGIKSTIDGMLKVANSLRTTMSSNGCQFVQELARTMGPAIDPHVEMLLQSFIKMTAATKHIAAENGRVTADALFQNLSYNARMMQHVWLAAQDKNVSTRQCAPGWLKTILTKQAGYKQHFEHSGGVDLTEKSIKKGLEDANPKVKESTRATYWTFAKSWPDKADALMSKLDDKSKLALQRDSHNPNASLHASQAGAAVAKSRPAESSSRMALREVMAEQRRAKQALADRPVSAMAQLSPVKHRSNATHNTTGRAPSNISHLHKSETRVASTASNVSATPSESSGAASKRSALMSGPVRRPRRPEINRPQTADPYAARRMMRPETPAHGSPADSPPKGTANSKSSIPTSSTVRNRSRTAGTAAGSPAGSPIKSRAHLASSVTESRPTSKGSIVAHGEDHSHVQEDHFTMVMSQPARPAPARAVFAPGHKRPALGQTMSVDNGIVGLGEDEGFTMVIPSNLPGNQQRARSPLAYRSPMKAMFEQARDKLERSVSPPREQGHPSGIDEAIEASMPARRDSPTKQQNEEVQVYEDPFTAEPADAPADGERKVLTELPLNENVRMQSPTQSNGSSTSPTGSPRQVPEATVPAVPQSPQDRAEVLRNRRLLGSGIERIRARTLDAHGLRRVQDLAKSNLDIWDGGKKYDELMTVLLDYLQNFDQDPRLTQSATKAAGLKAQAVNLVRGLLTVHRKSALAWHAKALVTLMICRQGVDSNSHILTDMERAASDIVEQAAPQSCIDATLDYFPAVGAEKGSARSVAMALTTLRSLLASAAAKKLDLGAERKIKIAQTAARYLDDLDAEVRKADVELASDLFELFGSSKAEFWNEFKGTDEGRLGLLTYYIARRGKAGAAQ